MELFTSFKGRISRQSFWIGCLGMGVLATALGFGLIAILPSGFGLKAVQLVILAGVCYVWAAIVVKRLHDRDKPALPFAIIFIAPNIMGSVMKVLMIDHTIIDVAGVDFAMPGPVAMTVTYISLAIAIWMVIELGLLKGTQGTNRFGPDPLDQANV